MESETPVDVTASSRMVVARDRDGTELLRRAESPLEQAQHIHGPVQPHGWRVHPACHNPPACSGVATLRFADGHWWCFRCEIVWMSDETSDQLTAAMSRHVESRPCPEHDGHLAQLSTGLWCPAGRHNA